MLFALALQLDIPVIFDYGTMLLMYNPKQGSGTPASAGQSGGTKKTKKNSSKKTKSLGKNSKKNKSEKVSGKKTKRERVSGKSHEETELINQLID